MRPDDGAAADVGQPTSATTSDTHARTRIHASCVELVGRGVAVVGPSGSGKSDLVVRLLDAGAALVADDQLLVERREAALFGRAPPRLAGLLEVRGLGIMKLPFRVETRLALVVELDPTGAVARLPEPQAYPLLGLDLPRLRLDPRPASAAAVVKLALTTTRHP